MSGRMQDHQDHPRDQHWTDQEWQDWRSSRGQWQWSQHDWSMWNSWDRDAWNCYPWQPSEPTHGEEPASPNAHAIQQLLQRGHTIDRLTSADLSFIVEHIDRLREEREAAEPAVKKARSMACQKAELAGAPAEKLDPPGPNPHSPRRTGHAADTATNKKLDNLSADKLEDLPTAVQDKKPDNLLAAAVEDKKPDDPPAAAVEDKKPDDLPAEDKKPDDPPAPAVENKKPDDLLTTSVQDKKLEDPPAKAVEDKKPDDLPASRGQEA